jgi:osmoprotectant transport system permease protein
MKSVVLVSIHQAAILLVLATTAIADSPKQPVVRIGSKSSIENVILGEMLTLLADQAGADARHQSALGGTQIVFAALKKGDIDAYIEYTGTLSQEILKGERLRSDDDIRAALTKIDLVMSQPLGFNNTYALGMKADIAKKLGIASISDLAKATKSPAGSTMKFGFSDEFLKRGDGWPAIKVLYQFENVPTGLDHSLAYRGLEAGTLLVTDLYSTDPEIAKYKLQVLEDDLACFPEYHAVILYRADLQDRAPQVLLSLLKLEGRIDNAAMMEMNTRMRIDHDRDRKVAGGFLRDTLQIDTDFGEESEWVLIGRDFLRNTTRHLLLVFCSLSAAVVIALPLGIWAHKYPQVSQGILGIVGIIQTIPSMAVLVFMIPLLGIGVKPAIVALFLYSLLPIVRNTYAGLHEIPGSLNESAIVLGLTRQARLYLVELPIASRSIMAGIKTAAVINVGTATIGGLIGAGGYGEPILTGLRLADVSLLLQGAVPAALLAVVVQGLFELLERLVVPQGLRLAHAD